MKRNICLQLVAILAFCFAACGTEGRNASVATESDVNRESAAVPAEESNAENRNISFS